MWMLLLVLMRGFALVQVVVDTVFCIRMDADINSSIGSSAKLSISFQISLNTLTKFIIHALTMELAELLIVRIRIITLIVLSKSEC